MSTLEIISNQTETMRRAKARLRRTGGIRSDALLETALSLFAEEGYRDVTIQKIAKRLRIRHSLIYYYFDSKEKLFHSALLHGLEKLIAKYGEVRKRHEHPVDLINDWFRVNVDLEPFLKGLINIMIDHASHHHKQTPRFVDDIVRDFYALEQSTLADNIRQGVKAGIFKCQSPDEMAAFISRNIDGIYYGAIVRRDISIAASMKKLRKIVWRLLEYEGATDARRIDKCAALADVRTVRPG
jgi:AcrR family transcriptional regulator